MTVNDMPSIRRMLRVCDGWKLECVLILKGIFNCGKFAFERIAVAARIERGECPRHASHVPTFYYALFLGKQGNLPIYWSFFVIVGCDSASDNRPP